MPKTKFRYAVTLEFTEVGPETVRGELEAANARLGARRAVEAALRAHPGRRWASLVVLLERPAESEAKSREGSEAIQRPGLAGVGP